MTPDDARGDLAGKVALVTGSGRGIGAAVALQLSEAGAHVVLTGRTRDELSRACSQIHSRGGSAEYLAGDITNAAFVTRLFETIATGHGRLDVLINNAGSASFAPIAEMTVQALRELLELNTIAPYACMQLAIQLMLDASIEGIVVNIGSSEAHWTGQGESGAYPASKFALRAMTLAVSKQMKADGTGIRICQVDPGGVDTALLNHLPPDAKRYLLDPAAVARSVVHVVTAPPDVHILETVLVAQPFATW